MFQMATLHMLSNSTTVSGQQKPNKEKCYRKINNNGLVCPIGLYHPEHYNLKCFVPLGFF